MVHVEIGGLVIISQGKGIGWSLKLLTGEAVENKILSILLHGKSKNPKNSIIVEQIIDLLIGDEDTIFDIDLTRTKHDYIVSLIDCDGGVEYIYFIRSICGL